MPDNDSSVEVLNSEFLVMRSKLLDLAASLDRIQRSGSLAGDDQRLALVNRAINVLGTPGDDRALQLQLLFSRAYEPKWRTQFNLAN